MIVALIGTPSPLTYLATNMLRALVQVTCGEHDMIGVNNVADLRVAWPKGDSRRPAVVVASDMPRPEFIEFMLGAKVPMILCLERLDEIAAYMVFCRQVDSVSALRIATQSLSSLEGLAVETPPAVIKMGVFNATLARTFSDLLRFCNEDDSDEIIQKAMRYLGFDGRGDISFSQFLKESREKLFSDLKPQLDLTPDQMDAHDNLAGAYNEIAAGRRLGETYWPASCFLQADTPGVPAQGDLELEGRARFLSHGPYFCLPAGLWGVEVAIKVSESRSENRVGFDVFSNEVLAACTTTLPQEGSLACDMVFRVTDPTAAVEIRIQLLGGAIEGKLRIEGVTLRRL
jgi:hypothetical protein